MLYVPFSSVRLVVGCDGCYLEEEMDVEKLILLVNPLTPNDLYCTANL